LPRAGEGESAARRIKDYFGLATLEGLGALSRAEIAAAAVAIFYIERTQFSARPALNLPSRFSRDARMDIDAATRANLELTRTLAGAREGSLLAAIDKTVTAPGSRLLAERLAAPLTQPKEIEAAWTLSRFLRASRACARRSGVSQSHARYQPRPVASVPQSWRAARSSSPA